MGAQTFQKLYEQTQNSRRQKGDMQQIPHSEPTDSRLHATLQKLVATAIWWLAIVHPCNLFNFLNGLWGSYSSYDEDSSLLGYEVM
jgi:hypothetical protein